MNCSLLGSSVHRIFHFAWSLANYVLVLPGPSSHICGLKVYGPRCVQESIFFRHEMTLSGGCIQISQCLSVKFSHSVMSDSLQPHGLQHTRLSCPSPIPGAYSNSGPLSRWCHATISSSVIPFSSCLQSFPASESFQMSQFFASGGQSIGVSALALVLPKNTQDWTPLGWTGWISLQSKGLSRVFSNTTVQKHQFFSSQLSW